MLKNYFKIAIRYLTENKTFTLVNVFGLSMGISAFILLFLYVYNDLSYDHFHKNGNSIYRVCENDMEFTRGPVLNQIMQDYPEVMNGSRFLNWESHLFTYGEKKFMESISYVDTGFFSVFSFPFIHGVPENALKEINTVVITRGVAEKFFGDENPVGKSFDVDFGKHTLLVTGVVEHIPGNSSIRFDMVTNYKTGYILAPWLTGIHDWYNCFSQTYVQLKPGTMPEDLEAKLQPMVKANFIVGGREFPRLTLLPLFDLHNKTANNKSFIYILICIAVGILLIASLNFINLSTAGSLKRSREVGLRKIMGAGKNMLLGQFLGESLIICLLGLMGGVLIVQLLLPVFNQLFGTELALLQANTGLTLIILLGLWLVTSLLSGTIPAYILSKFDIIPALKQQIIRGKRSKILRSSLVVFQMVLSIVFICSTIMIYKQIYYMKNTDLKFDQENVLVIEPRLWEYRDQDAAKRKVETLINELKNDTRIINIAGSEVVPGRYIENYNDFYPEAWSDMECVKFRHGWVSKEYFTTYGIDFQEGSVTHDTPVEDNAIVINTTGLKALHAQSGLNRSMHSSSVSGEEFKIAGVAKDYHYMGLQRPIQPVLHYVSERPVNNVRYISLRIRPNETLNVIAMLKHKWSETEPAGQLSFFFPEDEINSEYQQYERINMVVGYFSILAIIIACLGLYAMGSYISKQRTKEIGIRKVNGARVAEILTMLNRDFIQWVILAFLLALPLSAYAMHKWLENFAYKTPLSWWIFALAGLTAMCIALITISWQSWWAASRNPVESLRYE